MQNTTTTTCEIIHPLASLHQCKALWVVWRTHQTRNLGVEERKVRMSGSIPHDYSICPSPPISPSSPPGGRSACTFAHVTQYDTDYTWSPAMLDQQEKVVFFPFHGGEGKLRPKEGKLCPVPSSKAEFNGRELKSQEARWSPALAPNFSYSGCPPESSWD